MENLDPIMKSIQEESQGTGRAWKETMDIGIDTMEWDDLTPAHQHKIEQDLDEFLKINLGEDLNYVELAKMFRGHVLIELINGKKPKLFQQTLPQSLTYYVNRTLISRKYLSKKIFEQSSPDIFLFTGMKRYELFALAKNELTGSSSEQLNNATVRFMIMDEASHFGRICEMTREPVHLVNFENGRLIWVKSTRGIAVIQKCIDATQTEQKEEDFCQLLPTFSNMPICISDSPGMGKSILLANIGNRLAQSDPDKIVVYLELRDFIKHVKKSKSKDKLDAIKKGLADLSCKNDLEKFILNAKLKSKEVTAIELLLDGFDEVNPTESNFALEILKTLNLSFKSLRIWITSRPHFLEKLERNLDTLGYNIQPFTEEDQVRFLSTFWWKEKQINHKKLELFAMECLKVLKTNVNSHDQDIAGIPLQCLLIGEVYEEKAVSYAIQEKVKTPLISLNSITNLYKCLIINKFQKYLAIHMHDDFNGTDKLFEMHMVLSLKLLFPEQFKKLKNSFLPVDIIELLKIGIVEQTCTNEDPKFIHRTFAEYLVARFVFDRLVVNSDMYEKKSLNILLGGILDWKEVSIELNIIQKVVTSFEFLHSVICYFLNSMIIDFQAISPYKSIKYRTKLSVSQKKVLFHSCANANFLHLWKHLHEAELNTTASGAAEGLLLDYDSLLIIAHSSSLEFFKLAIKGFEKQNVFSLAMQADVLRVAVHRSDISLVEFLLKERELDRIVKKSQEGTQGLLHDCVSETRHNSGEKIGMKIQVIKIICGINKKLLDEKDEKGNTPLLSPNIHAKLMTELINLGANLFVLDNKNETVLHMSIWRDHLSCEDYQEILKCIPHDQLQILVGLKGNSGHIPLQRLVERIDPCSETLDAFKKAKADFNAQDRRGCNVLAIAIECRRSKSTIRKLIECGSSINWTGKKQETLVHIAAENGNADAISMLIEEKGMNVNDQDEDMLTPLDHLLRSTNKCINRFETGILLHELGCSFKSEVNTARQSWLHLATKCGNTESVQLLVHLGVDLEAQDAKGNTPLHLCVMKTNQSQIHTCKLLLENNANHRITNNKGQTPFQVALTNDELEFQTFQLLIAKTNISWTRHLATLALRILVLQIGKFLIHEEFNSTIRELEKHGADFNFKDENGNTLLHIAVDYLNMRAVQYLVEKGVDVNIKNYNEETPLHKAAKGRQKKHVNLNMMRYLIENNSNIFAKDWKNRTFLHRFASASKRPPSPMEYHSLIEYLVEKGHHSLFNIMGGSQGATQLQLAVSNFEPQVKTLCLLHAAGANFHVLDNSGDNILDYAVLGKRSMELLSALINQFGVNWKFRDNNGNNLLHASAECGSLEALQFFIDLGGLDVNEVDRDGDTPLHCALFQLGTENVLKKCALLIDNGSDFDKINKTGRNPLAVAIEERTDEVHVELEFMLARKLQSRIEEHSDYAHSSNYRKLFTSLYTVVRDYHYGNRASAEINSKIVRSFSRKLETENKSYSILHVYISQYPRPTTCQFHCIVKYLVGNAYNYIFNVTRADDLSTPMHLAIRYLEPQMNTMDLLYLSGAHFDAIDKNGDSVLAYAVRGKRSVPFLSSLIHRYGLDPTETNHINWNLLHFASFEGTADALKFLLNLGVLNVNEKDSDGNTPLHFAVYFKSKQIDVLEKCKLLVEKGADLNSMNIKKKSSLHLAAKCTNNIVRSSIIKYLIEQGAEVLAQDENDFTFLELFVRQRDGLSPNEFHSMIEYLVAANLTKVFSNPDGCMPIHDALRLLEPEIDTMALLYQCGFDFNAVDIDGDTALKNAVVGGKRVELISALVYRFGADWKALDDRDGNLLHTAAYSGTADVLKFLLTLNGLNVNGKNARGNTPLHLAVHWESSLIDVIDKCKLLIENGADVNIWNNLRRTPLATVREQYVGEDIEELVKLLQSCEKQDGKNFDE